MNNIEDKRTDLEAGLNAVIDSWTKRVKNDGCT